jgi:hypothetical protein
MSLGEVLQRWATYDVTYIKYSCVDQGQGVGGGRLSSSSNVNTNLIKAGQDKYYALLCKTGFCRGRLSLIISESSTRIPCAFFYLK